MSKAVTQGTYKQRYPLDQRIKLVTDQKHNNPQNVVFIVQKDPKCKIYPDLKNNSFSMRKTRKILQIYHAIRKRICSQDKKFENYSLFIFTPKRIPNKEMSIQELFNMQVDKQDGLLYLKYSDMEPFGCNFIKLNIKE